MLLVFFSTLIPVNSEVTQYVDMTWQCRLELCDWIVFSSFSATHTCEFQDNTICGYIQDDTDDFDWTQLSGPTPTANTGPTTDVSYSTPFGKRLFH